MAVTDPERSDRVALSSFGSFSIFVDFWRVKRMFFERKTSQSLCQSTRVPQQECYTLLKARIRVWVPENPTREFGQESVFFFFLRKKSLNRKHSVLNFLPTVFTCIVLTICVVFVLV
jgi:hypothetical protein